MQRLMNELSRASIDAMLCKSALDGQLHRLNVAKNDVEYYRAESNKALERYCDSVEAVGAAWLALMNSGVSHRRVLQIARAMR